MRRVLLISLLVLYTTAEITNKPKRDDLTELATAALSIGALVADKAIDKRWEIYTALTGKEAPISQKKEHADATLTTLQQSAVDLAVGRSVRGLKEQALAFVEDMYFIFAGIFVAFVIYCVWKACRRRE
jgi:hypothetical protein